MSERYTFQDWKDGKLPPEGWDCADAIEDGWTRADILAFLRATVRPWTPTDAKTWEARGLARKAWLDYRRKTGRDLLADMTAWAAGECAP